MNICFISYKYPGKHNTSEYAFVKQLVDAIASLGNHCFVLTPFNITHYKSLSASREEYTMGGGKVTVLRPGYMSLSNFHIGKLRLSDYLHQRALNRAFKMMKINPDVVYGHFWESAYGGYSFAKKNGTPLFVASGESEINVNVIPAQNRKEFCEYVSGVVCVSTKNKNESVGLGLTVPEKCKVFPNSINAKLFRKLDKKQCREELGFPQDAFILAFVGWFIDRKGPKRVSDAIRFTQGKPVYSMFIGKEEKGGEVQNPDCDNILFKGALPHEQIPMYLNAADVFVLPTLHEGCCNAVVEAMACGLPIISSNRPFNWDVLNEGNSIMVDPQNVTEIASAIQKLKDDEQKRQRLSQGALEMAKCLTIENRAQGIIDFIKTKI